MRKIHSQLMSVSGPPISQPAVPPMPPSEPQIPSALLRSAHSSKVVVTIASAASVMPVRVLGARSSAGAARSRAAGGLQDWCAPTG
jgi:hypothetical protein